MDFRLNAEQGMLRDGARRYVATELSYDVRTKRVESGSDDWAGLAEMGWLMLPVPEAAGGLGSSLEEMALVAEELGRGVALEPFIFGAVLPARLLHLAGDGRHDTLLEQLGSGEQRFAAALYEAQHRYKLHDLDTTVRPAAGGGYVLSGEKTLVFGGAEAHWLIVAARIGSEPRPALFRVAADAAGVRRRAYRTIDNLSAADIAFDAVNLDPDALVGNADAAGPALARAIDEATVLICADAVGCADRAIEMTAEYLRIRKQFGQTLASFQALQHGVANLFIEANDARSIMYRAVSACLGEDAALRSCEVSAAKLKVLEVGQLIAGQSVHFHGGIGMTCEYPVGEHLRRMLVAEQMLGNAEHHLERYLALTT